jgi:uncharacterized protein YebE (UPF0316 family)
MENWDTNMDLHTIATSGFLLPVLIFVARVIDVSIGTIRIIFISRNMKYLASLFGFFEILIWLYAIGRIMQNISNPFTYIAYAGGFAMGNLVGMVIENKLALGVVAVRVITNQETIHLAERLRKIGYTITTVNAQGNRGAVKVVFAIVKRKSISSFINVVKKYNPKAFYTIENVGVVAESDIPQLRQETRLFNFLQSKKS